MTAHRSGRRGAKAEAQVEAEAPPAPYGVLLSEHASDIYKNLHRAMTEAEKRGENNSSHHTVFRMIEETIKVFIPRNPIDPKYGLKGALSKFFRIKKGRHRICWAANSTARKVCVLFISETLRKDGDKNDPYVLFEQMVKSGQYDHLLKRIGFDAKMLREGPPEVPWN
jgi:hypothetical protein